MKEPGSLVSVISGGFAAMTALIGFLGRSLLKAQEQRTDQKIATIRAELEGRMGTIQTELHQTRESFNKIDHTVDAFRDKLDTFFREDAAMEAIRGRKVDALFQVVDHIKEEVRQFGPDATKRIEDMFIRAKEELRGEINSYMRRSGGN